jgi:hypothetical protein
VQPAPAILFDCADQAWSVKLLALDHGRLVLMTNPTGRTGATGKATASWEDIRHGFVVGQGGGHQSHVRLFDGVRSSILFEGVDGALADRPGRTYAGVVTITEAAPDQDFQMECPATTANARIVDGVTEWAARSGAQPPRGEDVDGPFDGWF